MMVPSSSHPKARDWVILGLIVAVATLVRVLAMDGAATLGDPVDGAPDALIAGIIAEASAALIGLPAGGAVLSGVLAVPVIWVLAWQAGLALPVAHGLAAALALASPHVWASADPGGGTLGVLAVLLAGLLFLAGVRGRSVWPWVALGPVAFVALIASPSAALGIATLAGIWLALFIWSCIDDLEGRVGTLQPLVCFALAGLAAGGVAITLGPGAPRPEGVNLVAMVLSLPGAPGVQAALLPVVVGVLAFGVLHLLRRSPVLAAVVVVHPVLVVAILGRLGTGVLAADLMATLGWAIIVGTAGLFTLARLVQSGLGPILGWRPENRDLLALIALGLVLSGLAVETGLGLSRA